MVRRAAGAEQDHNPRQRKSNARAASVPIQRESPLLELVSRQRQPGKQPSMNTEDAPSSSLPSIVVVRGRKRDVSALLASPQTDPIASTSIIVADPSADASGKSSRKRPKRSTSTPAAPKSSQIATQLKSRRRSRSRAGSPLMDLEYVPPTRISARLARKTHPFILSRSSDIYTHLADPSGGGSLLNDPPSGSIMLCTPDDSGGSRPGRKPRGRPRKTADLTDDNVKGALMEEWARIRALPLLERNEHVPASQDGDSVASASRLGAITPRSSPRPEGNSSQATTVVDITLTQETLVVDVPVKDLGSSPHSPTQQGFDNDLHVEAEALPSVLFSNGGVDASHADHAELPALPAQDSELLSTATPQSHPHEDPLADETASSPVVPNQPSRSQIPAEFFLPELSPLPAQNHSMDSNLDQAASPLRDPSEDGHSIIQPISTHTLDEDDIHLEDDAEFHLLEVPEMFTLPWEPEASHMYVPPGLGKLIAGMRGQLTMEARARRRAEELYQMEMKKRIAAEQLIGHLRALLEVREHTSSLEPRDESQDGASLITSSSGTTFSEGMVRDAVLRDDEAMAGPEQAR